MNSTMKVNGTWKSGFRVDVNSGDHSLIIDQPESSGGKDEGPNSLEVLLFALAGCLGTVAAIIAKQERIELRSFELEIEGDIDKSFTMGKTDEGRAGFTEIRVKAMIDADLDDAEKLAFLERVDSRCPTSDNLINQSNILFELI